MRWKLTGDYRKDQLGSVRLAQPAVFKDAATSMASTLADAPPLPVDGRWVLEARALAPLTAMSTRRRVVRS